MIVAAVAETNECVIVTDNEKHFSGLEVLNPLLRMSRWNPRRNPQSGAPLVYQSSRE